MQNRRPPHIVDLLRVGAEHREAKSLIVDRDGAINSRRQEVDEVL
jgi:hypothetical protein